MLKLEEPLPFRHHKMAANYAGLTRELDLCQSICVDSAAVRQTLALPKSS